MIWIRCFSNTSRLKIISGIMRSSFFRLAAASVVPSWLSSDGCCCWTVHVDTKSYTEGVSCLSTASRLKIASAHQICVEHMRLAMQHSIQYHTSTHPLSPCLERLGMVYNVSCLRRISHHHDMCSRIPPPACKAEGIYCMCFATKNLPFPTMCTLAAVVKTR